MRSARVWVRASEGFAGCERLSMTMAGDTNKSEPRRWSFMPTAAQRGSAAAAAGDALPAVLGACLLCCVRRLLALLCQARALVALS